MRTGYSLLLGEYVPADRTKHGDTAGFQIVCPCCKDPLIKVERSTEAGALSEFFSHYASKPGAADCEMRVASLSSEALASANSTSRGQTLKLFSSVFRDTLSLARREEGRHDRVLAHSGVQHFAEFLASLVETGEWPNERNMERYIEIASSPVDPERSKEMTGLSHSFRTRLAADMVKHLRAPHAERNRRFAARFAIGDVASTLWIIDNGEHSPTGPMMAALENILTNDDGKFFRWLDRADTGDEPEYGQLNFLLSMTSIHLISAIMQFPALRMLGNHRAGRPLLDGIEALDELEVIDGVLRDPTGIYVWDALEGPGGSSRGP